MSRLLIMAAGTGGHIFPGLAIADTMRARGWQVSWLGTTRGMEADIVPRHGVDFDAIDFCGEFEDRAILAVPFTDITECIIAERVARGCEIFGGNGLAQLRGMDNRAFENAIVVQDFFNFGDILR